MVWPVQTAGRRSLRTSPWADIILFSILCCTYILFVWPDKEKNNCQITAWWLGISKHLQIFHWRFAFLCNQLHINIHYSLHYYVITN